MWKNEPFFILHKRPSTHLISNTRRNFALFGTF